MTKDEAKRLEELSVALEAIQAELGEVLSRREKSWTVDDLKRDLERWKQELRSTTNTAGQPYSPDTISTHTGHAAQFIRWLAGEWQPTGPRHRP